MKTVEKQVIVKNREYSWYNYFTTNPKFIEALLHAHCLSKDESYTSGEYANAFWVIDFDGTCRAAQPTKEGALKYFNPDRSVLVHYQIGFVTY